MHVANQFLSNPQYFGPLEPRSQVASDSYKFQTGTRNVGPISRYNSLITSVVFLTLSAVMLAFL
jgi:hypothetical protein